MFFELIPHAQWLCILLGVAIILDAGISIQPITTVRRCLEGVGFPLEWRWGLVVVKLLAGIGLIVGLWVPGVGITTTVGVVVYFLCATAAHLKARFYGQALWGACLPFLVLTLATLLFSFLI